jgi:multiple sugar transport system substrate-binding protein
MKMPRIVLISALVSCALLSGCKDDKASAVTIEFMHSSVEQERQAVITKLIEKFEKENPGITVKQVPVEEDAYNTKVITLARTGALPEVIEVSHDYAKVMDKEQLLDRDAIAEAIKAVGKTPSMTASCALFVRKTAQPGRACRSAPGSPACGTTKMCWPRRALRSRITGNSFCKPASA